MEFKTKTVNLNIFGGFMKKLWAVALVFVISGAAVFGEITFSGNGSTTFVPFGARFGDPVETVADSEVRWGNDGPRIQLVANGKNQAGNIGAVVAINADSGGVGLDDNAKVWIKLNDVFKITFGKFVEDDLRYKIGVSGGGFHNYMLYIRGNNLDESAFFSRFKSGGYGAHLAVTPVENLYLGMALGSTTKNRSVASLREDGAADVWANAQIGAGYKIPDVGFIRLQFNGQQPTDDNGVIPTDFKGVSDAATGKSPSIQAAFQLTAVKGLNVDIGGQIPFPYTYDESGTTNEKTEQRAYVMGVGFDYTLPAMPLRLYGRASYKFGGYTETTPSGGSATKVADGNDFVFFITPMYTVAPNWIVGLDCVIDVQSGSDVSPISSTGAVGGDADAQYVAYWNEASRAADKAKLKNNYADLGFGLYVRHNISGGDIRVGATLKLPGGEAHKGAKPQFFVPIIFNYNF
jgi:hypothetical protein